MPPGSSHGQRTPHQRQRQLHPDPSLLQPGPVLSPVAMGPPIAPPLLPLAHPPSASRAPLVPGQTEVDHEIAALTNSLLHLNTLEPRPLPAASAHAVEPLADA